MIDIHHHLLFGTDDGPKDLESSIAQAEMAIAEGITHIVCTPHANGTYAFNPEQNRERLAQIRERVGDRLNLGLGCDFHLSYDNIEDALKNPAKYTLNQGSYLLVEFAEFTIPQTIGDTFREFVAMGLHPIITHPERNPILQKEPQRMVEWMRTGCLVQITAASLGGRFGKQAKSSSWELLEKNWVHFIATDAHSLEGRPPLVRPAWESIAVRFGEAAAQRLFVENPRAAFESVAMPPQPEPEGITGSAEEPTKRTGLAARLFGK